jgi:hypothetical protein
MIKNSVPTEEQERYDKAVELYLKKNTKAVNAVIKDDVPMTEKIFKTIGVEKKAIEHLIFSVKSVEMIKLLIQYGADIHKLGPPLHPHPRSLLFVCSIGLKDRKDSKSVKLMEFLIEEGVDVNVTDVHELTVFWNCIIYGELGMCILLVERGADPNFTRKSDKRTALHDAALTGRVASCRYLVEDCGLDIEAMTRDLQTPLYFAAYGGNLDVCKYLLEKGASVDLGDQPLSISAQVF